MQRTPVSSSEIQSIGYDAATQTLEVEFHSGGVYQYFDVPASEYQAFMAAASHGQYLNQHIKNTYRWQQAS
jgi:hypothetical protein